MRENTWKTNVDANGADPYEIVLDKTEVKRYTLTYDPANDTASLAAYPAGSASKWIEVGGATPTAA